MSPNRPTVQEILLSPFLKSKMEEFINSNGEIGTTDLKVRTIQPALTPEEEDKEALKGLTGRAYLNKKKELQAKREADRIKEAMKKNYGNYGTAKERMYNEFYTSKGKGEFAKEVEEATPAVSSGFKASGRADQFKVDPNSVSSFGVNDRYEDTYELSNSMGTQISALTEKDKPVPMGSKKFSNYNFDDREIKASGSYKFEEDKDSEDYNEDFEEATKDAGEMEDVLGNYKRILSGDITNFGEDPLKKTADGGPFSPITEAPSEDEFGSASMIEMK